MEVNVTKMTFSVFEELWRFIVKRSLTIVQEQNELEHVFNLMKGCESYLEIGTAEGNSLYVLAHALKKGAKITCVDFGEGHTKSNQDDVMQMLSSDYEVGMFLGNSMDPQTLPNKEKVDCVLIDGGHDYNTVISDARMYAPLATKYSFFHDVKLPEVKRAVDEYVKENNLKYYEFINSPSFGYGIVEVK